ncbi:transmembrane protein 107-like [Mobula birostris]|uniref:transmembrane protein 107-like n=1 Tax=Mobula birostris TaxID=1983395 RepID=UPI003B27CFF3
MLMPSSLTPSRFLTLVAHFVIVVNIFWSRGVLAGRGREDDGPAEMLSLITPGGPELRVEGVRGVPKRSPSSNVFTKELNFAIGAHGSASAALLFFLFEQWPCNTYWWIFTFCSVFPACIEIVLVIAVFGLKKKPF